MPSLDDVIRKNKDLMKELQNVTEKLTKNEVILYAIKEHNDD